MNNYKAGMRLPTEETNVGERNPARQKAFRIALSLLFMGMGILHFAWPAPFARIIPPFLPNPRLLVAVSGIFEFLGGLGVLIQPTRRFAGYGLIALLLAVWPANFLMAYLQWQANGWTLYTFVLLLRLPLQIPLILWVRSAAR